MARIDLVVIDPQYDFCASATTWDQRQAELQALIATLKASGKPTHLLELFANEMPRPTLSVAGCEQDMERVGAFIKKNKSKIDNLHITLDAHQDVHIAHPVFWKNPNTGQHPAPFTQITVNDVHSGIWTSTKPSLTRYGIRYVEVLEMGDRYPLIIWPPHCLIGTIGHTLYAPIAEAGREYAAQFATINYVTRGSNVFTEHYSAVRAEVDPTAIWAETKPKGSFDIDPSVFTNLRFLEAMNRADKVLICGETHCLANTFRDAVAFFPGDSFAKKLVLLKDGTSPLTGFEYLQNQFINEMVARSMEIGTTDSFQF